MQVNIRNDYEIQSQPKIILSAHGRLRPAGFELVVVLYIKGASLNQNSLSELITQATE